METPSTPTPWQKIVGPVLVGVGAAGAVGVLVASQVGNEESAIPNGRSVERANWGPTLAFVGAGVAVAALGVVLWVSAPSGESRASTTQVSVGAGTLQLDHRF